MVRVTRQLVLGALVALTASLPATAALAAPPSTPAPAGCAPAEGVTTSLPPDAGTPTAAPGTTQPTETSAPPATELDAWQAVDVALRTTPGFAFEVDAENERGRAIWEVKVHQEDGSGIEHYIAVDTGEVLRSTSTRVPRIAATPTAVDLCAAIVIATDTVPGSQVVEADLDTERGRTIWEVLVRTDTQRIELYVDAETGEVLRQEIDD